MTAMGRSNPCTLIAKSLADDLAAAVRGKEDAPAELLAAAEQLASKYEGQPAPEAVKMLLAIASGSLMGPGDGWFGPAATKYHWNWLADRHSVGRDGRIPSELFQGPQEWFKRLDRNGDGAITAEDLDWSEQNSWVQYAYVVNRLLRRLDTTGNGLLTRQEWTAFFDSVAGRQEGVEIDRLRETWLTSITSGFFPGDAPTLRQLLDGLLNGEVGSLQEGPGLNQPAPDFCLKSFDGAQSFRLSEAIGQRPIVLIFGNFSCSPFRSMYPGVELVASRFGDAALFRAIYVREAHPADGWKMASNDRVGVTVAQPTTYAQRAAVATQCHRRLNPSIPLLVDEIDDPVGNAYSGMPARLYVIDRQGQVVYKSGRGPFGFKVGEMEQALVMTLLDEDSKRSS